MKCSFCCYPNVEHASINGHGWSRNIDWKHRKCYVKSCLVPYHTSAWYVRCLGLYIHTFALYFFAAHNYDNGWTTARYVRSYKSMWLFVHERVGWRLISIYFSIITFRGYMDCISRLVWIDDRTISRIWIFLRGRFVNISMLVLFTTDMSDWLNI